MTNPRYRFTIIILLLLCTPLFAWEKYDRILAVVNDQAIIKSDVDRRFKQLLTQKKVPARRRNFEKSRILDKYIEDALIMQTAKDKSIIISDKKILLRIEPLLKRFLVSRKEKPGTVKKIMPILMDKFAKLLNAENPLPNKKVDKRLRLFIKSLEKKQRSSIEDIIYEMRIAMQRQQVMSIAIGVSPPSKKEARKWYKKNRRRLGAEVNVKHILIKPKARSLSSERKVTKKLESIKKRVQNGESFEKLARKYSQDPGSARKGGSIGWAMLAQLDPYFAGTVSRMNRRGQLSRVFKSSFGYHLVKFVAKRSVSYERVEPMILNKLYGEKVMKQYKKWVIRQKKTSDIKIFMKNYSKS